MKLRSERSRAGRQKIMEGVNMPASLKFSWRWMVGATAVAIVSFVALPGVGHAENIEICVSETTGKIKGINLGVDECTAGQVELDWVTTGPVGDVGPTGVTGDAGPAGAQGVAGLPGATGPTGAQGAAGPQGPEGVAGPTGPTGPAGIMGNNGVRGPTGLVGPTGPTGPSGVPGIEEANISVFTGGSLGGLGTPSGGAYNVGLSGFNSVGYPGTILIMGPGNGADTSQATEVPMSEAGTAERLFINVDADPGTEGVGGSPSTFFFFLCDGNSFPADCDLTCTITAPDTSCSDLVDTQTFAATDLMSLWAYSDYFLANEAHVKWSVTYDHGAEIIVPGGV
ncbi:MAG: hypothetical protein WBY93_07485 [Candidatus Binatus sp.]